MEPKSRVVGGARGEQPSVPHSAIRASPSVNVQQPPGESVPLSTNEVAAAATIKVSLATYENYVYDLPDHGRRALGQALTQVFGLAAYRIQSFLSEQGVDVSDSRLDSLQAGLDALFAGDGDEELEDESNRIVRAAEVYRRNGNAMEPPEVTMDLAAERHSLWGHRLWNAARVLADLIDANPDWVKSKAVLELGAGAALPSLIAALNGACTVVMSDYQNPHSNDRILVDVMTVRALATG